MKDKLKNIIGNGLPWGVVFFGLSFILGRYLFNVPPVKTLWMSVFIGVCALLANGFIYRRFSKSLKELEKISIEVDNAELLLLNAPANHLVRHGLVPGKLFLTDQRIIFKPHVAHELRSQLFSWDLTHLKPAGFFGSLWNSGGEFLLKTKDETSLMFEVNKLKPWKEAFNNR